MAQDKKLHLIAGFLIAAIAGVIFTPACGLALATAAGVAKEAYDYFDYGLFDAQDMLFTWGGGVLGYAAALLLGW